MIDDKTLIEENQALIDKNFELESTIRQLSVELEAFRRDAKKSAERLLTADREADELNKAAAYRYMLELKTLKLLAQKYRAMYQTEVDSNLSQTSDWIIKNLADLDKEGIFNAKETAKKLDERLFGGALNQQSDEKVSDFDEFLQANAQDDTPAFDLEEAINPTTPLDLKELLNELGI